MIPEPSRRGGRRARAVTREDLAAACSLSISSVSLALNRHPRISHATQERVAEVAERIGFSPNQAARRLIRSRYKQRGGHFEQVALVVLDRTGQMLNDVYVAFFRGVERQTSVSGANMIFVRVSQPSDWDKVRRLVSAGAVDAFILAGEIDREAAVRIQEHQLPWIVIGDHQIPGRVNAADMDYRMGGRTVVERLARMGHRRIGLLGTTFQFRYQKEIRDGFCQAVRRLKLDGDKALVEPNLSENWFRMGLSLKMLLKQKPTAIFFSEPGSAAAFSSRCKELGMDLSQKMDVVFCELNPSLAAGIGSQVLHLAYEQVGQEGVTLLKELVMNPRKVARQVLVAPAMVNPD